jgi:hypothetical protein
LAQALGLCPIKAKQNHGHTQSLPHRHAKQAIDAYIRLPHCFCDHAEDAHPQDEMPSKIARLIARVGPPEEQRENDAKQQAFEPSLIELAGMAHDFAPARKDHAPWHCGFAAPQFPIHKIGKAAKEMANWIDDHHIIHDAQPTELFTPRKPERTQYDANHPTMEGHTAFP